MCILSSCHLKGNKDYGEYCKKHRNNYLVNNGIIVFERFTYKESDYLKKDIINTIENFNIVDKKALKSAHLKLQFSKSNIKRLGIVIPKRIVPLSVTRNSLRRRMRGFFRDQKFPNGSYVVLLSLTTKIQAEKKIINDILMREWKSLLSQLP